MDIGFTNVQQTTPPQMTGVGGEEPAPEKASAQEKPALSLAPRAVGASELARVTGEESVDEAELRRDDDLGRLARKAFDPKTAAAALPTLDVEEGTAHRDTVMRGLKDVCQAMIDSSYETSKTIIDNMVDSPEERAEKAAREAERQAKEFDEKTRLEERTEKEFQNTRILDEIAANRLATEHS